MTNATDHELLTVDGGSVDMCLPFYSNYPTAVQDGDWCFGIRITL